MSRQCNSSNRVTPDLVFTRASVALLHEFTHDSHRQGDFWAIPLWEWLMPSFASLRSESERAVSGSLVQSEKIPLAFAKITLWSCLGKLSADHIADLTIHHTVNWCTVKYSYMSSYIWEILPQELICELTWIDIGCPNKNFAQDLVPVTWGTTVVEKRRAFIRTPFRLISEGEAPLLKPCTAHLTGPRLGAAVKRVTCNVPLRVLDRIGEPNWNQMDVVSRSKVYFFVLVPGRDGESYRMLGANEGTCCQFFRNVSFFGRFVFRPANHGLMTIGFIYTLLYTYIYIYTYI